jgi:phospholipid-binding lipoprotein MlaA
MTTLTSIFRVGLLASALLVTGCATTNEDGGVNDPLESYNRVMYKVNQSADRIILKPAAKVYDAVLPAPISHGVSNFFSNLNEITVIINDLLQFKFGQAMDDLGRFGLNTTVGIGGLFDVAGHAGYEKNNEDFGQTLGVWGAGSGAYVVLPIFGPRTTRDTVGLVADWYTNPITYIDHDETRYAFWALFALDKRSNLLKAEKVLDEAALDEYTYVRDAYLQHRQNLVYDGNPPEEDFDVFSDE